jgi:hypothetical protein
LLFAGYWGAVVLLLLPLMFFALGVAFGNWWFLIAPVVFSAGMAIFLIANDGWYGAGWGEFGVELNLLVAALSVVGAATGVALRKGAREAHRRSV